MGIQVFLLGPPEVRISDGKRLPACAQSLYLLGYIATRPDRAVRREALGNSLWAEANPERQRGRLNTALWRLRKLVGDAGLAPDQVLECAADRVALRADAPIWFDIDELRACWRMTLLPETLSDEAIKKLTAGARLYRGRFLAAHDEDWCVIERESLTAAYQSILDWLLEHHAACEAWRAVIDTARQMLELDPLLEHAHRATIRAHGALGERVQAARQFRRCESLLAEELGIAPLPETEEALRTALAAHPIQRSAQASKRRSPPSLAALIGELKATVRELERLDGPG